MEINFEQSNSKGSFFILKNGARGGELTFSKAGDKLLIIDHTEVSDELRGQDAGLELVSAAVAYAREHHLKILPLCPFSKSVFTKVKEFQDVLFI